MTPSSTADRQAGEARAMLALLHIAKAVGWRTDRAGPALSIPFANYLHCNNAQLLLVPSVASIAWQRRVVDAAMREARSDALIVSTGPHFDRLDFAIGLWRYERNDWLDPVWPWVSRNGLWFGSDKLGDNALAAREGRLLVEPAPWRSFEEKNRGRARALGWLERAFRA